MTTLAGDAGNAGNTPDWAPAVDFWLSRPVAVTGATGFLGGHLVGMLVGLGASVVILARDQVRPVRDRCWQPHHTVEEAVITSVRW